MPMVSLWTLPVPSTALIDGVTFEKLPRRQIALRFSYELEESAVFAIGGLLFEGVESFKCTFYGARDATMLEAYDKLVDCCASRWLGEIRANVVNNGGNAEGLRHLMIMFDDGPT